MYIPNSDQIRKADQYTLMVQKISSAELMERAAGKCADRILELYGKENSFAVFCGPGNNGGDGLVIARLLKKAGAEVFVFILPAKKRSKENSLNLRRVRNIGILPEEIDEIIFSGDRMKGKILIDALLGSGLNRPVDGNLKNIVTQINQIKPSLSGVIAIDSPSGFFIDSPMPSDAVAIHANLTLCLQCPRLMFFFPESYHITGQWEVLHIGLEFPPSDKPFFHYTLMNDLQGILGPRPLFSHKGNYGHALIAGGSKGKCGAMILTTKACLRSGAGLATALIPECCDTPMQVAVPEAMTICGDAEKHLASGLHFHKFDAIGFGPGAGIHDDTAKLLKRLIQEIQTPMVIDADGLNILSENKTWVAFLPEDSILTPHPGEFDRLSGKSNGGYERMVKAKEMAIKNQLLIVLKGAFTLVALPDGTIHFNSTGNPGMATAGSGDVLTGIITALLSQGLQAADAARMGVFAHGLAGDIAREKKGDAPILAGDIVSCLSDAWSVIMSQSGRHE